MQILIRRIALCAMLAGTGNAVAGSTLEGELSFQGRLHPGAESRPEQTDRDVSAAVQAEWYWESEDRKQSFTFTPFARGAVNAGSRDHVDLREFYWNGVFGDLELRAGVSKVFWGKTEINHLVDIINQDDALENLDREDKLGQPMLRLSYRVPNGNLIGFVLPYSRERKFLGPEARLAMPLPVDDSRPIYEDDAEEKHLGWALRWQGYLGGLDFGLAHFSGTARNPQLILNDPMQPTGLLPVYALLDQTSLDAQFTWSSWLFKLEAFYRDTAQLRLGPGGLPAFQDSEYSAVAGGFEYTLYGVMDGAGDLGLLAEYLWDEREEMASTPFQNDLFVAARLGLNDMAGTALLAGAVVDLDHEGIFINIEGSRRIGGDSTLSIEARLFSQIDERDFLFGVRNDDYLQIEFTRYF